MVITADGMRFLVETNLAVNSAKSQTIIREHISYLFKILP